MLAVTAPLAFAGRSVAWSVAMEHGKPTPALAAQHVLVCFFLAAGCQPLVEETAESDPTAEEYFEARAQLDCDLALECGHLMRQDECPLGSVPSECAAFEFSASAASACLDAMEELVDAAGSDAYACGPNGVPEVCADVITWGENSCPTAGRPLFVDGEQLLPPVVRTCPPGVSARAKAAEHWLQCARMESASVPAFTRLAAELASVGAPTAMSDAARDAADDEIRHTRLCLGIAERLVDAEFSLGPLPDVRARAGVSIEQLAIEALLEGCIGEGSAAAWACIASKSAGPQFARTLGDIAGDELRHAALSWRVVGWALRRRPGLGPRLRAALDAWEEHGANSPIVNERSGLEAMGVLSPAAERAVSRMLVSAVVRPTLEALCSRSVCTAVRV